MSVNNDMFIYFKTMKQGYAENNNDVVEQCARCWMQLAEENPFKYDTPEYEEFFQMKRAYTIWARGDVNGRINRRNMVKHAKALCALNPKQPYIFDKKADEEEKKAKEAWIESEQQRKQEALMTPEVKTVNEEPQIILGVIPEKEEKKSWFKFFKPAKKDGE